MKRGRGTCTTVSRKAGQKLDFNVTVVGTAELDTYVNNELLNATKLGVEPPHLAIARAEGKR